MAHRKYRDIVPFGLRLQPTLKKQLEEIAYKKPNGSLNSEIVQRLEQSLVTTKELKDYSDGELIDELIRRYGRDGVYIQLGEKKDPA